METDKKAREDGRFTLPRMFFLLYLVFLLSLFQSSMLYLVIHSPAKWVWLSSANSLSKFAELFEIERRFSVALAEKNFYFGLGNESEDGSDIPTGFLVATPQFGEKSFLFTASHVVSIVPYRAFENQPLVIFPPDGGKIEVEAELKVSLLAELAAAHAPEVIIQKITPAILYTGDNQDLIRGVTPLAMLCNPSRFVMPLRVGFFGGFSHQGYMTVEFSGLGPQNGCSGGPIIDEQMRVRGLVTGTAGVHSVVGVPSLIIAQFLTYYF